MTALYRKYRPQDFTQVVGQEAVVRTLTNAINSGQVRQAYLFAGPRGTGKTSLARILAKALNCAHGPTPTPDGTCNSCRTIATGTSLDVVEMDAASQRGIDDIREIRERAVLQPVEGRHKVYILDEAHQLTDAAWNALLKLIEEPPPHLVFIFCTTEASKVIATVRSRCQVFAFQRPRHQELVQLLRRVCDGEEIAALDSALALIARSARGSFRDAVSTLDQLSSATGGDITVPAVLQLLGSVEEEALFRLIDLVIDRDTAGALTFIEELSDQGQDLGRLTLDLLEHLRHLLLVQHMGSIPDSLPLTDETRERLRSQANQVGEATVLRLCELLVGAVESGRQGGDPRLPLELSLVKVTRPQADLSRESIAFRIEQLEQRPHGGGGGLHAVPAAAPPTLAPAPPVPTPAPPVLSVVVPVVAAPAAPAAPAPAAPTPPPSEAALAPAEAPPAAPAPAPAAAAPTPAPPAPAAASPAPAPAATPPPPAQAPAPTAGANLPPLGIDQLRDAWERSILPAISDRSIPLASILREARPAKLEGSDLTLEFAPAASFHRQLASDEKNMAIMREVLREVTGRSLAVAVVVGAAPAEAADGEAGFHPGEPSELTEDDIISMIKDTLDAREVEDPQ